VRPRYPHLERECHVVGEHQGRSARAALSTVDRDEVDAAFLACHPPRKLAPEGILADRRLEAYRKAGLGGEHLDEVEHLVDVAER